MNKEEGYIYVLFNPIYKTYGDNIYKIGRTNNIDSRLKSFITSYIEPSTVKFSLFSKYFIDLEKEVHKKLNEYRINPKREYFNCDLDLIVKTIETENNEIYILKNNYENKTENIQYKNKIKTKLIDYNRMSIRDTNRCFRCEKCLKNFSTKQNLKVHGKSCKGHKIITSHKCDFCGKMISTKHKLNCHLDVCKKKKEKNDLDLKTEIKELKEAIKEIANKPQTIVTNNITNNTVNKLISYGCEPLDLSLERFDKALENYDFRTLTNFRIFSDIIAKFYSNDKGKICSYLSDLDRLKIKSINKDYKVIIDDPESIITKYFSKSKVLRDKTNEFISNNDIKFHKNRDAINKAVTALSDRIALKKHLKKYKSNFITKNSIIEQPEIQIRFIEN